MLAVPHENASMTAVGRPKHMKALQMVEDMSDFLPLTGIELKIMELMVNCRDSAIKI